MSKTSTATKKTEPDFPAGKKQENMNDILQAMRPTVQADPARFLRKQHAFNTYVYWAQSGSLVEEHLAPEFWYALSSKFQPNDEIVIKEEFGAWRIHCLIKSIGSDGIDIVLLSENQIGGTAPVGAKIPFKDGPRVEYRGQHLRWSVFDGDKELISGLRKESDAVQWLQNNNVPGAMA